MYNRQQSSGGAETDRCISALLISTRILKNKKWVVEDGQRLFKGDTVFPLVFRGLRVVPFKGSTTVFADPIH